jgi:hypothetical protein
MDAHIDAASRVAAPGGAGGDLKEAAVDREGVVLLDGTSIREAADRVEVGGSSAPRGGRIRGASGEACVVAGHKSGEHAGRVGKGAGVRQAELDHETILEGAEEPFDPTFGLRGMGADPLNAQLVKRASDLGMPASALELLLDRERGIGVRAKDAMAIGVDGDGHPVAVDNVPKQ